MANNNTCKISKRRQKSYYCNPLNMSVRYSWNPRNDGDKMEYAVDREAADPTLVYFHDKYMLFPSMTAGFYVSYDLVHWDLVNTENLPAYDYAPDVRVIGDYLYFCASKKDESCDFYRSKDPGTGIFERIEGTFPFWDPDMFLDDDGRLYFYWGCSNETPIYGVELDPNTLHQIGVPVELISGDPGTRGYERIGENNYIETDPKAIEAFIRREAAAATGMKEEEIVDLEAAKEVLPDPVKRVLASAYDGRPWIEGAFMTKHNGRYYLQYACPATEYNIYCDGCYVSDSPLGPFALARNNPFSYVPGGFITGAGHGSTIVGSDGSYWHASSSRISISDSYERRVSMWPAGFDTDGELFCNQRYANFPIRITDRADRDPWADPDWMLLSSRAKATASSEKHPAANAVQENIRTFWKAEESDKNPTLLLDLRAPMAVSAIQVNFADDLGMKAELPSGGKLFFDSLAPRYIDTNVHRTRWLLEGSLDGEKYRILADKREADTDLPHDFVVLEEDAEFRYIRLQVIVIIINKFLSVSPRSSYCSIEVSFLKYSNFIT